MVIRKPDTLCEKPIYPGRLDDSTAMTGKVAVTLVIGEDQDDVGHPAGTFTSAVHLACQDTGS
jgi:hypothetical protein